MIDVIFGYLLVGVMCATVLYSLYHFVGLFITWFVDKASDGEFKVTLPYLTIGRNMEDELDYIVSSYRGTGYDSWNISTPKARDNAVDYLVKRGADISKDVKKVLEKLEKGSGVYMKYEPPFPWHLFIVILGVTFELIAGAASIMLISEGMNYQEALNHVAMRMVQLFYMIGSYCSPALLTATILAGVFYGIRYAANMKRKYGDKLGKLLNTEDDKVES